MKTEANGSLTKETKVNRPGNHKAGGGNQRKKKGEASEASGPTSERATMAAGGVCRHQTNGK